MSLFFHSTYKTLHQLKIQTVIDVFSILHLPKNKDIRIKITRSSKICVKTPSRPGRGDTLSRAKRVEILPCKHTYEGLIDVKKEIIYTITVYSTGYDPFLPIHHFLQGSRNYLLCIAFRGPERWSCVSTTIAPSTWFYFVFVSVLKLAQCFYNFLLGLYKITNL